MGVACVGVWFKQSRVKLKLRRGFNLEMRLKVGWGCGRGLLWVGVALEGVCVHQWAWPPQGVAFKGAELM